MSLKWIVLLFVVLVACAPAPVDTVKETSVEVTEESTVPEPVPKVTEPVPVAEPEVAESEGAPDDQVRTADVHYTDFEPYSDLGCKSLLVVDDFALTCDMAPDKVKVTYRIGTRNCYVTMVDNMNSRLTAGISLRGYDKAEEAQEEFDRRMDVLDKENDGSVGEKSYSSIKVNRHVIDFVRGSAIVSVGADLSLCNDKAVLALAKIVDGKLSTE